MENGLSDVFVFIKEGTPAPTAIHTFHVIFARHVRLISLRSRGSGYARIPAAGLDGQLSIDSFISSDEGASGPRERTPSARITVNESVWSPDSSNGSRRRD